MSAFWARLMDSRGDTFDPTMGEWVIKEFGGCRINADIWPYHHAIRHTVAARYGRYLTW